jgi:hypothetical protein
VISKNVAKFVNKLAKLVKISLQKKNDQKKKKNYQSFDPKKHNKNLSIKNIDHPIKKRSHCHAKIIILIN